MRKGEDVKTRGKLAEIEAVADADAWDDLSQRVRAQYTQILRTIIASRLALPATKERARKILRDHGIPLRRPVEGMGPSHPDVIERNAQDARFRGMVRKQRARLMAELRTRPVVQIDDGPRTLVQAAEDLVKIGEAVMISDEMLRFTRGNCKEGETKRRLRRVIRIGAPDTIEEERI